MNKYQAAINRKFFRRLAVSFLLSIVLWGISEAVFISTSNIWEFVFKTIFMAIGTTIFFPLSEQAYDWLTNKFARKKKAGSPKGSSITS